MDQMVVLSERVVSMVSGIVAYVDDNHDGYDQEEVSYKSEGCV